MLRKAELIDAQEDQRYGKSKHGDELPKELRRRQDRIQELRKAKAEPESEAASDHARQRERKARCAEQQAAEAQASSNEATAQADAAAEAEAAKIRANAARRARAARQRAEAAKALALQKAEAAGQPIQDLEPQIDPQAMPSRNLPTNAAGEVKGKAQRNHRCAEGCAYTDPDSHSLKGGDGWIQGYNCQVAVDGDQQVIVAVGISNHASDTPHLLPMLERILSNTGQMPDKLLADAGYCSTDTIEGCEQRQLDAYISTGRQRHGKRPRSSRGPAPRDHNARGRMDRKIGSKAGKAIYALRKIIAEPVFGQIKAARGLDRFLLRGTEKTFGELNLMAITHNLIKLHRAALNPA